jgi:hypothetical protein
MRHRPETPSAHAAGPERPAGGARPNESRGLRVSPARRVAAYAVLLAAGVGMWAVLRPASRGPDATIAAFEAALAAGDEARAHALVDYRHRLSEVLGPLFDAGPEADRAELERLTREMLVATSRKQWPTCCEGREMARRVMGEADRRPAPTDEVAWVVSRPADGADFRWEYRLHRKEGAWRITQREYTQDGILSDSTRFWPMARKAVARRIGREPTLGELTANLEAVKGDLRVRAIRVPSQEELARRLREQSSTAPAPTSPPAAAPTQPAPAAPAPTSPASP